MIRDNMSLIDIGNVLYKSGFFTDAKDASQAIVKVLAGRELGFGPIASMTGVNVIKGKIALSANLMAAAIKRTNKYNYRIIEHTDAGCEIAFFEGGQEVGRSKFTIADAKKAGIAGGTNWAKYPRNMTFARALSNGAKWYCADVFGGPIYTPDELGANVDAEGEIIDVVAIEPKGNGDHPGKVIGGTTSPAPAPPPNGDRPYKPEVLKQHLAEWAEMYQADCTDNHRKMLAGTLNTVFEGDEDKRYDICDYLTEYTSTKDIPDAYIQAMLKTWLEIDGWDQPPSGVAIKEAHTLLDYIRTPEAE